MQYSRRWIQFSRIHAELNCMFGPTPEKRREWKRRAALKNAIVPAYFEVSPVNVFMFCGKCENPFKRNLITNQNEPTYICPNRRCKARNWVPVQFQLRY
jgi:hypothetical protein